MRVRPSEGGLEVYLVDKDSEPLYAVDVDAEHFVDVGLRDRKFVLAAGAREAGELNGLRHIRIVRDLQHDRVRIRVKASGIDLTSATEVRTLTLTLVFGEGETLTCMSRVGLTCSSSGQKLLCQQEK